MYARFRHLGPKRLVRALLIIWATWIILGQVVGYTSLVALVGTIILLIPSPALAHTVHLLSRSLFVRRGAALLFLLVFGSPPDQAYPISLGFSPVGWFKSKWAVSRRPSLAFAFRPKMPTPAAAATSPGEVGHGDDFAAASEPIYFRFEVHENQRWWMGLDWTSALLPQERPSWCDNHLQPVSPPASYTLPAPSAIVLPNPTKADPKGRVKRIATWQWLDDDWSIVRAGQGPGTVSGSAAIPSSILEDDGLGGFNLPISARPVSSSGLGTSPTNGALEDSLGSPAGTRTQSIAEQAFTKGLERLKARTGTTTAPARPQSMTLPSPRRTSEEFQRGRKGSQASDDLSVVNEAAQTGAPIPLETIAPRDEATDADGWVYGDNKWENMSTRGGLGKVRLNALLDGNES